jgi:hypothetical protein
LAADGWSVRAIAKELRVNRGKVHRVLMAHRGGAAVVDPANASVAEEDPILSLLTADDLRRLGGVSRAQVAVGLTTLERYRILGLQSPAGDACRALFDHGRNAEVFDAWMDAGTGGTTPEDVLRWLAG